MDSLNWVDKKIFVTGASGLLGSWLVKRLISMKSDVVCLLRDWIPNSMLLSEFSKQVNIVSGDVTDQQLLERIMGEYEIDIVFHLAAQTIVGVANRNPISTFESDIKGVWCLLESCRHSPKIKSIVVASSDKCYRGDCKLPYTECMPLGGDYPYDVSKSCADLIAQSYFKTYNLPVGITRCGNLYGGGDLNWNRIIPGTIRSLICNEVPIIRSDGSNIRDYFYVKDCVNAYIRLAECIYQDQSIHGNAFNFSSCEQVSVVELVNKICALMNSSRRPVILNEANNEIKDQRLDSSKALNMLGWKSDYSLDQGIVETISWYKGFLVNE